MIRRSIGYRETLNGQEFGKNMSDKHRYNDTEREAIYRVIEERRDMRHFLSDPIPEELLMRLLKAAHHAPSVGYMQPWRFVRITSEKLRSSLHDLVRDECQNTADALSQRRNEFMRLKVEGIRECAELLVVALCEGREKFIFGRRTLPQMDLASAACAIQNMWLAARAEGLGMGWVSLFDPLRLAELLRMPPDSLPIAILCIGQVESFYDKPMLEKEGWDSRRDLDDLVYENGWKIVV